jgi:hypothetical protein
MIPLNEVQEEDQRNMTTDEYKVSKPFFISILGIKLSLCLYRLIMKLGRTGKTVKLSPFFFSFF